MKYQTPSSFNSFGLLKPLSLAVSSCILAACSSTGPVNHTPMTTPVLVSKPTQAQQQEGMQPVSKAPTFENGVLDDSTLDFLEDLLQATDMTMVEGDALAVERFGNLWDRIRLGYRVPEVYNARIEAQKSWFYTRQNYIDRLIARASRYLHYTVAEAERRGIPSELALLPIIESSYDPSATSNAAAAGLWQFIPSTGRIYGLNQSQSYDGRRDVIESTRAAYDFLTSLYNQFGSWELALAAYNAGPGRVSKAIAANQADGLPTDYWSLRLPTETMNYVPRFLAVAQIVRAPSDYNVSLPAIANHNHFRTVPVNYGVSLGEVASLTGVPVDELRLLNPALLNLTVDEAGPNRLVIPDSLPEQVDAEISALAGFGYGGNYAATATAQSTDFVRLKGGVSNSNSQAELVQANALPTTIAQLTSNNTIIQEPALSQEERDFIAAQIQASSAEQVQAINPKDGNIELNAVQTSQSVLDARGESKTLSFAGNAPKTPSATAQSQTLPPAKPKPKPVEAPKPKQAKKSESYVVKAGDNLTAVAAANGLSVSQLASYNNLTTTSHILIGQRLWLVPGKVKPTTNTATSKASTNTASTAKTSNSTGATHKVKSGESLTAIAKAYNVSLQALAAENGLSVTEGVIIGQTLKLPANAKASTQQAAQPQRPAQQVTTNSKAESYTVKSGDSLTAVAAANGLSLSQLASYNNLKTNASINVGQRLWLVPGKVKPTTNTATSKASTNTASTAKTSTGATHKVKSGESLTAIAKAYNVSLQALAAENGLSVTEGVIIGQTLKLPANAKASTQQAAQPQRPAQQVTTNSSTSVQGANYTVKAGESLTSLAARAGVSVSQLASMNGLSTNTQLRVGQAIKLPKTTTTYTVKAGDGLISLAKRYGISVQELAKMNNLESNANLRIGQKLTVPNK